MTDSYVLEELLKSDGYINVSKLVIKAVGLHEAVIISELYSERNYWRKREKLRDGKWFFSTRQNIEENTGLTPYLQRDAIQNLVNCGVVCTKKMDIPAKLYYSIDDEAFYGLLSKALTTSDETGLQQDQKDFDDIKTNKEKIINKTNNKESIRTANDTHSKLSRYKNKSTLTDDLGSTLDDIEKKSAKRRRGKRYDQEEIELEIQNYTDNPEIQDALRDYVGTIRSPEMGDRMLKNADQFRGYLKKLSGAIKNPADTKEIIDIILYSTLHCYLDFYPVADRKKKSTSNIDKGITSRITTIDEYNSLQES